MRRTSGEHEVEQGEDKFIACSVLEYVSKRSSVSFRCGDQRDGKAMRTVTRTNNEQILQRMIELLRGI